MRGLNQLSVYLQSKVSLGFIRELYQLNSSDTQPRYHLAGVTKEMFLRVLKPEIDRLAWLEKVEYHPRDKGAILAPFVTITVRPLNRKVWM